MAQCLPNARACWFIYTPLTTALAPPETNHKQMAAGMDTRELYRVSVQYKSKLGPFATPRILGGYLKASGVLWFGGRGG